MAAPKPKHIVAWQPQPGPQTLFVQCPAYEVGYGGALGGGKTDALLGDFAAGLDQGQGYKGIFIRKHNKDMDDVIQRSIEIFGPVYGQKCYKAGNKMQWEFPNGAILQFRPLERDSEVNKYIGQQYCVAAQQLTRMADGSLKEIQDIEVGEMVETLEGPRAVLVTHGPYTKECVEAVTVDQSGSIGVQVHPLDHEVLMSSGKWGSYASGVDDQNDDTVSSSQLQDTSQPRRWYAHVALHEHHGLSDSQFQHDATQSHAQNKSSEQDSQKAEDRRHELKYLRRLHELDGSPLGQDILPANSDGISCAMPGLETIPDSSDGCLSGSHPHDGQPQSRSETDQCDPPSQDDVASRSQSDCRMGDLGNAPEHTRNCGFLYEHPYTGEKREAVSSVSLGSCVMTPCGEREVYDLTVDCVNHYITPSGVVNRNSTIMWDQLEQWDSPWAYTFLMTRNRSARGIKAKVRSAFNPGGVGSGWVQARFIDPMAPGEALKVDTHTPGEFYHRVFIPAKLEDNQILVRNDPGYGDRIYECSDPILADALRRGLWDKIPNASFSEFDKDIHVIDPYPIPQDRPVVRALDWGFKTPYACLWGFPTNDGDFIIANEMYGWTGVPNVGTEESPETVRAKIEAYESAHELFVPIGLLDGQCWKQDGSPDQIAEQLGGSALGWQPWPKGPQSRVNQKMRVHEMLKTVNGKPRLKIMRNCRHLIRTLPTLPRAKNNWEDVDTDAEDHAYDALRAMLTRKIPTRDQIRQRAMRRRMASLEPEPNLRYGEY